MKLTVKNDYVRQDGISNRCDRCVGLKTFSGTLPRTDLVVASIPFCGTFTLCPTCITYYRSA